MTRTDPASHPVRARDIDRWSQQQWKRWCVEQAVTARAGGATIEIDDLAGRLLRFVCPSIALAQPIE